MVVSIITINYNNIDGLRKTINSVLIQTWKEFEWIIVDGGSTDGSRELIEETAHRLESQGWNTENFSLFGFAAEEWKNGKYSISTEIPYSSISTTPCLLYCSEKDDGVYNAMNKGIITAHGDYCLFLNSGDYLYSDDVLFNVFNSGIKKDIVVCDVEVLSPIYHVKIVKEADINMTFFLTNTLPHQSSFIKRSLFDYIGLYNESLKTVSDWEFFVKAILFEKVTVAHIPLLLSVYVGGGISDDVDLRRQERAPIVYNLLLPRIIDDYSSVESLCLVRRFHIFRVLYSCMYRISFFLSKWTNRSDEAIQH